MKGRIYYQDLAPQKINHPHVRFSARDFFDKDGVH